MKKATALYAKAQSVAGTAVVPAATDVVALANFEFTPTFSVSNEQFAGDALNRDTMYYLTDSYAEASGDIFIPCKGTAVLSTIADFKLAPLFSSAGANCALTGTTSSDQVITITNGLAANTLLTAQVRKASADVVTDKVHQLLDARAMFDIDLAVGSKFKSKVSLKGGYAEATQETALVANFGNQKNWCKLAPLFLASNTVVAELSSAVTGYTTHVGDAGTVKNICISKLSGSNIFGFDLQREQNTCESTFQRSAVASDLTITVKEDIAGLLSAESATYINPELHVGESMLLTLKWGSTTTGYITLYFDNITLQSFSPTTVGDIRYTDLKFGNSGYTTIKLSQA